MLYASVMANHRSHDDPGLAAVFKKAGTKYRLAKALGIKPQAISQWKKIPPTRVLQLEGLYQVPPHIQRPDLYRDPGVAA
jgi:DNA-binding transcriptional regulator YdaS (Cro superfamily)